MGLSLKLKREFLRCISPNCLKTFRNGFIGRNRTCPATLSTAAGQGQAKIRLLWQKSSLSGLLSSPSGGLLSAISVLDDSRQREQDTHRDGKRFIVRAHEKLTECLELQRAIHGFAERVSLCIGLVPSNPLCDSRIGDNVKKRGWSLGWALSGATRVLKENFLFFRLRNPTQTNETIQ